MTTNCVLYLTISLTAINSDVDAVDGGLTIVEVSEPQFGVIEVVDNEILYTPDENYNGPDTFTYEIIDSNGFISQADVFVEVSPVNDPPLAIDDTATTPCKVDLTVHLFCLSFADLLPNSRFPSTRRSQ